MNHEITELGNGIKVIAAPLKERRSVSVGIWVGVGGRDEAPELCGVSHFLEHLVFKGTERRDANQIKESVEGVGGSLNAFTSEEYTCFLAKSSSRHFDEVFDVLADMVLNATLREEDIRKERTVILEEIKMTQDQPAQLADELLTEILWPGHALGRPLAGTIESVSAITREGIAGYRDAHYQPGFITISASGDVTQERLVEMTRARFAAPGRGEPKTLRPFEGAPQRPGLRIQPKDTEQLHLAIGLHTFEKDHPDQYNLDILSVILGGNMSSRLFNEVREERGLAYDIGSFTRKFHETGAFVVTAGVDEHKLGEALDVIMKELSRVAREPVHANELKRAKEFYLGQLDLSLENTMNQMLWAGESVVCHGRVKTPEEVAAHVERITPDDLLRLARNIFRTPALRLSVVGKVQDKTAASLEGLLAFSDR